MFYFFNNVNHICLDLTYAFITLKTKNKKNNLNKVIQNKLSLNIYQIFV